MNDRVLVVWVGDGGETARRTAAALGDQVEMVTAPDASGTLDVLARRDVDCLVTDGRLPDTDGLAFLNDVRERYPELPVMFLAGHATLAVREALSAGATDYFRVGDAGSQSDLLANRIATVVESYRTSKRQEALSRIRTLVSDVNQALIRAGDRAQLDARICEILTRADPYRFAWIGELDEETGRLEPREWAGQGEGYLEDITTTVDGTPVGAAVTEGSVTVVGNVSEDPDCGTWREPTLERGFRSLAAVPLVYDDTRYGVLVIYADRIHAFDDEERTMLGELGDDIAHAFSAIETRQRLAREKERFRRLVAEVEEYAIFRLDPDGHVSSWNDGARRLQGYTREEIVGDHVSRFYPEDAGETDPETVLATAAAEGSHEETGWRVRKDGSRFWARTTVTALRGDAGELRGFAEIVRDLTHRRDRERTLRRFERAVEAAGQGVYITDTEGTIEYVNPAFEEITGYSRTEALGRTPRILKSGEMSGAYYENLWTTLLSGENWEAEVVDRRKNGEMYYAHQTIAPILDEAGDPREFVAIQTDITERKERERQLRVLDRVLRHNLNNDLNVIRARAEAIRASGPPEHASDAARVVEKTAELSELVDKEREITRVLTEEFERTQLDVARLVERTVGSLTEEYPDATIDIDVTGETVAETIPRVDRALTELTENAVVHNDRQHPVVTVSVHPDGDTVRIDVTDDGPGIPEMERAILLGEADLDPLYHGSGLGLWLVYWIVRRAGGALAVAENDPRGSVVTVELPRPAAPED